MATFNLVPSTPVGPSTHGNPTTEAQLAQVMVNVVQGRLTSLGMTITAVYDNSARTLTFTYAGTAS
jgi:hypothetical protein